MTDIAVTHDARARAERIRVGIHSFIATRKEIADAYRDRDWAALGYESWDAYVDSEFSETRVRLTADERREAVAELRIAGMSQRAISATLGVSVGTVNADLAGVQNRTPAEVTGTDGKSYASSKPARPADLKPRIVRQLTHAGPEGLTVADIAAAWPGAVSHDDLQAALGELEETGQVEPAGRARRGNHMEDLWALAELPTEDHPPGTGEGRSAGLPSALSGADESDASVVGDVAADELPAGPDPVALVNAALEQFVPDPGREAREWGQQLYERLEPINKFTLWFNPEQAAEFADQDDIETLRLLAHSFAEFYRKTLAARDANVVPLRRVQ
jgi:hypothetical protein